MGRRFYELWKEFKGEPLDELCEFYQDYYQYAKPSFAKNKAANLDGTDYANQEILAVNWLRDRADFIWGRLKLEVLNPGDVNNDGETTIGDATLLIDYLLLNDSGAIYIDVDNADVNDDGEITIADVTALIDKLLSVE